VDAVPDAACRTVYHITSHTLTYFYQTQDNARRSAAPQRNASSLNERQVSFVELRYVETLTPLSAETKERCSDQRAGLTCQTKSLFDDLFDNVICFFGGKLFPSYLVYVLL